jgi:hypothetical protein
MKKTNLLLVFCLCFNICLIQAETVILAGVEYNAETLSAQNLQLGVRYTKKRFIDVRSDFKIIAYFLEVDMDNPYLRIEAVVGQDSVTRSVERVTAMAIRKSKPGYDYFAGINADFFDLTTGRPHNGVIVEDQIGTKPTAGPHIAFSGNRPVIDKVSFSGSCVYNGARKYFTDVNRERGNNELIFYNQLNGTTTHTGANGVEVMVQLLQGETWGFNKNMLGRVVRTETDKGNMAIPPGYAVLSGNGTMATYLSQLSVGNEIKINLGMTFNSFGTPQQIRTLLGAQPEGVILNEGVSYEIWAENHPRSGIGYSKDGKKLILCIADGRSTVSQGCYTQELADMMKSMGAWYAVNFDGGGSSAMYIKELGGIVNVPSDGSERAVGNAVFLIASDTPYSSIPEIQQEETELLIYPNPVTDYLIIESGTAMNRGTYELYNLGNQAVQSGALTGNHQTISLANRKAGIYILRINTPENTMVKKIIKQ